MGKKPFRQVERRVRLKIYFAYWKLQNDPIYIDFYRKEKDNPLLSLDNETEEETDLRFSGMEREMGPKR